jgi:ATP-dependent DNA helicase HFM1/MER3
MTRKFKNSHSIMKTIRLFLIDEIHVINENSRGSTIEAVVSRMKALSYDMDEKKSSIRFMAVSATIPNIDDFSLWLSSDIPHKNPAIYYKYF